MDMDVMMLSSLASSLDKMCKLFFLHFTNAPTEDAVKDDIDSPTNERRSKTVVFESTFTANEDQPTQWEMKGEEKEQGSSNHGIRLH